MSRQKTARWRDRRHLNNSQTSWKANQRPHAVTHESHRQTRMPMPFSPRHCRGCGDRFPLSCVLHRRRLPPPGAPGLAAAAAASAASDWRSLALARQPRERRQGPAPAAPPGSAPGSAAGARTVARSADEAASPGARRRASAVQRPELPEEVHGGAPGLWLGQRGCCGDRFPAWVGSRCQRRFHRRSKASTRANNPPVPARASRNKAFSARPAARPRSPPPGRRRRLRPG